MSSNSQPQHLMDMMRSMQSQLDSMITIVEVFLQEKAKQEIQSMVQSTTQPATRGATQGSTVVPHVMTMDPSTMAETLLKPSSAITEPEVITLPPSDQLMLRYRQVLLFCFRLDPEADLRKVYSELRCGLSDALVEIPCFGGRIVKHDEAHDRIQINLSPDDGVAFIYKDLTSSLNFEDLEQEHFPPSKLCASVLTPVNQIFSTGDNDPALLLQANFIKGGLILATAYHHSSSDAVGMTTFFKSWARHTAAVAKGSRITPHRRCREILDRSPLFQVNKDATFEQCEQLAKVDNVAERINKIKKYFNGHSQETTSGNIVHVCWYFSPDRLQALKAACQPTNTADPWVSTNDALSAFLWRHVTIARRLTESAYDTTAIQVPCNIRGRLSPKLHPEYVGNAVVHAHYSCRIQDLCSTASNGLYLTASAIRRAIERVDETTVRNVYGLFDSLPTPRAARANMDLAPGPDFFVTSMAANDWHGFDWGNHLGRAARFRFPMAKHVTTVAVMPRLIDGGLEVSMGHEREVIERLRLDETFTTFAKLRCY